MDLSQKFFKTVFSDAFIFNQDPLSVLQEAKLNPSEHLLAMRVWESDLYDESNIETCIALSEELSDIYR